MYLRFDGKTALVTGAGKGIGRATAKALARCGANVIALSRTQADLDSLDKIPGLKTVCVDISNWDATREAVSAVGPIDLLVNNAAIAVYPSFLETTKEQIDKLFEVNIKAVFNITQVVVRGMVDRGNGGAIVNVSSSSTERTMPNGSLYIATKGALQMLTKSVAIEHGKDKIRVNDVQPYATVTQMTKDALQGGLAEHFASLAPLGRIGEIEDSVNSILFLLSDRASMITGTSLAVDGGYSA